MIKALVVIHFEPRDRFGKRGTGSLACRPTKRIHGKVVTGHPPVATCPKCRASESWQAAMRQLEGRDDEISAAELAALHL